MLYNRPLGYMPSNRYGTKGTKVKHISQGHTAVGTRARVLIYAEPFLFIMVSCTCRVSRGGHFEGEASPVESGARENDGLRNRLQKGMLETG